MTPELNSPHKITSKKGLERDFFNFLPKNFLALGWNTFFNVGDNSQHKITSKKGLGRDFFDFLPKNFLVLSWVTVLERGR